MTTETKVLGSILILTVVLLFGGVFLLSRNQSPAPGTLGTNTVQIDYSKGQKIGSDSAKVKLVEFSDLECPACLNAEPVVKKIRASYSPDQLQFIYRHFPLSQHPHSRQVASLAEAAGEQGKFWEMHDKLFETQTTWAKMNNDKATTFFMDLVKQLNLDENKVKKALDENTYLSKINDDLTEGQRLGVDSTPTFYLNGRKVDIQLSYDDLTAAVTEEIKKQNK